MEEVKKTRPMLTVVVNTCDSYSDVLQVFFIAFEEFWSDCPYPVVINAEANDYPHRAQVHNYISPDGIDDWGARLRATLETVDSEYVLMLYDDFILERQVDNHRIATAVRRLHSSSNAAVTYLIHTGLPVVSTADADSFCVVSDWSDYRLNSAPAIWRKSALMEYTKCGDTPWAWEVFGSYRTWGDGKHFFTLEAEQDEIYPYNHSKGGAIYRGKWVREVVESVSRRHALDIDWARRGFSSDSTNEKRSLAWKIGFLLTGVKMVGFRALYFIGTYARQKFR
jgi:hypothetical protein